MFLLLSPVEMGGLLWGPGLWSLYRHGVPQQVVSRSTIFELVRQISTTQDDLSGPRIHYSIRLRYSDTADFSAYKSLFEIVTPISKFITKGRRSIVPIAVGLGFLFLFLDAFIDAAFFDEEHRGLLTNLVDPEPMDLWMRIVVFALIVCFSFYARFLMRGLVTLADELTVQRDSMAQRVAEATHELQKRNNSLEEELLMRNKLEADLRELAITDPLTKLFNRRKFLEELAAAKLLNQRYKTGVATILCDIDRFKAINDANGHNVGDAVLIRFAELLKQNTRETDIVARWGGEEFAVLVASNEAPKVVAIAEKLRQSIQDATFPRSLKITASFGVAMIGIDGNVDALMNDADKAMYQVKSNGRNAVGFFGDCDVLAS